MNNKEVADILQRMDMVIELIAEKATQNIETQYTINGLTTDDEKLRRAVLADNAFACLYDVQQKLRAIDRYGEETNMEQLREWFTDLLYDNGINLDVLYT